MAVAVAAEDAEKDVYKRQLEVLKSKKKGNYNIVAIDPDYIPAPLERRTRCV